MKTDCFDLCRRAMVLLMTITLAACGAGGGTSDVAGVGSGGSGIASGSVSGFGSVIVDGVEYDDTSASRLVEDAGGALVNTAVKLGQRVRVMYGSGLVATQIEVQAQLAGPVSAAPAADGSLTVMGQRVRVITASSDASQSSPTVLEGYVGAGAIAAGDEVEVHGAWVYDSARAEQVLVASRIEKLAAKADPVLLGGVVTAIDGKLLRLNSASGTQVSASVLPTLAVGDVVRVWVSRGALALSPAPALRVASLNAAADLASGETVSLSGPASEFDPTTRTVVVQGVKVKLPDSAVLDDDALARGGFVTLQLSASGSTVMASGVSQRSASVDLGRTVEVKGVTRGVDWTAAMVSFVLRDTTIQAASTAIDASCKAVAMSADVLVDVRGSLSGTGAVVSATQVTCSTAMSGSLTADYVGTLAGINLTGRSLNLQVSATGAIVTATWDDRTYFEQRPDSLPLGLTVEVEGVMDKGSGTLRLSKVKAAD